MTDISVVVIIRNEEDFILDCLKAILSQSISDFELIAVDDNSQDETGDIIKGIDDRRIKYFRNGKHLGIPASRNKGVQLAKGKYIFFTDADCLPHKDWLKEGLNAFCNQECIGVEGRTFSLTPVPCLSDRIRYNLTANHLMTCNIAYRAEVLNKIGGFNPRYPYSHEDGDLALRAMKYGKIGSCLDMLVFHRTKKWTARTLLLDARRARDSVRFIKEHNFKRLTRYCILYPMNVVYIFFPFLIPFHYRMVKWTDFKLLPVFYLRLLYQRILIWKEAVKERIFLL